MGKQSRGTLSVRLKGNRQRQVEKQRPRSAGVFATDNQGVLYITRVQTNQRIYHI